MSTQEARRTQDIVNKPYRRGFFHNVEFYFFGMHCIQQKMLNWAVMVYPIQDGVRLQLRRGVPSSENNVIGELYCDGSGWMDLTAVPTHTMIRTLRSLFHLCYSVTEENYGQKLYGRRKPIAHTFTTTNAVESFGHRLMSKWRV